MLLVYVLLSLVAFLAFFFPADVSTSRLLLFVGPLAVLRSHIPERALIQFIHFLGDGSSMSELRAKNSESSRAFSSLSNQLVAAMIRHATRAVEHPLKTTSLPPARF